MDEIKGIARVKFHPGKLDEWKRARSAADEFALKRRHGITVVLSTAPGSKTRRQQQGPDREGRCRLVRMLG